MTRMERDFAGQFLKNISNIFLYWRLHFTSIMFHSSLTSHYDDVLPLHDIYNINKIKIKRKQNIDFSLLRCRIV